MNSKGFSNIYLYSGIQHDMNPQNNKFVDNIDSYLLTKTPAVISNFQFIKTALEVSIILDAKQIDLKYFETNYSLIQNKAYDYVKVMNVYEGESPLISAEYFYYFIVGKTWKSQNSIQLELRLDVLNTYAGFIKSHLTDQTLIRRQHKDRYYTRLLSGKYQRKIDRFPENFGLPLMKKSVSSESNLNKFYFVYMANTDSATIEDNPIRLLLFADNRVNVDASTYIESIVNLDRKDARISKIEVFPYQPVSSLALGGLWSFHTYDESHSTLEFNIAGSPSTLSFGNRIKDIEIPELWSSLPVNASDSDLYDPEVESKLYNSEFYMRKFAFNDYAVVVKLENIKELSSYLDSFKVSQYASVLPIDSIMYEFELKTYFGSNNIIDEEDFPYIIQTNFNHEASIFTNDYLNYIKYSEQFEVNEFNRQERYKESTFGLQQANSIFGGALSGLSGASSLASSGEFGILSAIPFISNVLGKASGLTTQKELLQKQLEFDAKQFKASQEHKKEQLKLQASTIGGMNSLGNIFALNNFQIKDYKYKTDDALINIVQKTFHLFGYSDNTIGKPNLNSRYWFNYIECEADFDREYTSGAENTKYYFNENVIELLTNKLREGATLFHAHNNVYDFAQARENWESWLIV